jgi:site-specific DNA recombinase
LQNHFYYGTFEYPKKSGNWYQGKHTPLINKELFDKVQSKIKDRTSTLERHNKEFAFTKLLTCGLCGSGITADEKYKKLKNGEIKNYIYYTCTKVRDRNCKCGYVREEELIKQLETLIDQINIDELCIKEKIKHEIERFKKFQRLISNKKSQKIEINQIDIKNYLKFILEEGSIQEKREILSCLKNKLILKNKQIHIEKI